MANGNNEETPVKPSEMSEEELPDVRAFQDEFTRGFMKSAEEVEDGFYVFESGTGLYEMWLPGGAVIGDKGYSLTGDDQIERVIAGIQNENETGSELRIQFEPIYKEDIIDLSLSMIDDNFDEDLTFEKEEFDDKIIYFAPLKYRVDEGYGDTLSYVIFIQNKTDNGGAEMIYSTFCKEDGQMSCREIEQKERENAKKIAYSFKFKSKSVEGEDK